MTPILPSRIPPFPWRLTLLLGGSFLVLTAAVVGAVLYLTAPQSPGKKPPPDLGGQAVPDVRYEIDFAKRYDVYCRFKDNEPTVFRNCKIVGFTSSGQTQEETSSSSRLSGRSGGYFARWLVLELTDGRRAYIPPTALQYLEEAKVP